MTLQQTPILHQFTPAELFLATLAELDRERNAVAEILPAERTG